jgi:hypothetical protein
MVYERIQSQSMKIHGFAWNGIRHTNDIIYIRLSESKGEGDGVDGS